MIASHRLAPLAMLLAAGCAMAPGIRMQDAEVQERHRGRGEEDFAVQEISIPLLQRMAQASAEARARRPADPLGPEAQKADYLVAPYDVLQVTVWDHPELTLPAGAYRGPEDNGLPVNADGTLFYPYVGLIQVAGKTVLQIREQLTAGLRKVVENPQVSVRVAIFRAKRVEVTGAVKLPQTLAVTDVPMRLSDAVARAGGLAPEADPSRVALTRAGKTTVLDLQSFYEAGDLTQNWLLVDGDVVQVGDGAYSRVFVFGEVRKPGAKPMLRGRMSLAEALAESEGVDPSTVQPSGIYVLRQAEGKPLVFRLDATSADAFILAAQFALQPKDVVFAATNDLARFNRVVTQILPTVQTIWQTWNIVTTTRYLYK